MLRPEKLQTKFITESDPDGPAWPRKYTLTHSDISGELFLSIGTEYDHKAVSGLYTRIMRDEVLAEFLNGEDGLEFHILSSNSIFFRFYRLFTMVMRSF
jgi:hypothetical protein